MAEALDTLITLGWWALGWILVLSAVLTIALLTVAALGAWAFCGIWRTAVRPTWARSRTAARRIAHRTRQHDYREAA